MGSMTIEKQIKDLQDRSKKVSLWSARIEKLAKKKKPLSESKFCEKYGFHKAALNRQKKSVTTGRDFPTERTFKMIEKALKAEGV